MGLPNFAEEQPGETYYMSPLNIFTFGVVDCGTVPSHLMAYVFLEGDSKKGGNSMGCCNTITKCLIVTTIKPIWHSRPVHHGTNF